MENRETVISLTGRDSHTLRVPPGQGSLSIGTRGLSQGEYDLWVERGAAIHWDAFNGLYTGYGLTHREKLPYGDWPRWIYYSGSDTGFLAWSAKRRIEEFHWTPQTDLTVDFTAAGIDRLSIHAKGSQVRLITGENTRFLTLSGALENFRVEKPEKMPALTFCPDVPKGETLCRLSVFPALAGAGAVTIDYPIAKTPFDCESLLQFPGLENLSLYGSMANLRALAGFDRLEALALRYVPDLEGMPKLTCWGGLKSFIGFNIEEDAGKALRAEVKQLKKERPMEYCSVTHLRKSGWFDTEYGLPFSAWEGKNGKAAVRAYKKCANRIKKSETEDEAHRAVREFIGIINRMDRIETGEREDVGVAVEKLAEYAPVSIPREKWELWFEEERDF